MLGASKPGSGSYSPKRDGGRASTRLRSERCSGWSSNRSSTRLSASPPRLSAREERLFTACSRGTLGNRFFFEALTSLRQGCDVEWRVYFVRARSIRESYPHKPPMNRYDAVNAVQNGLSRALLRAEALLSQMKTREFAIRAYRSSMRLFYVLVARVWASLYGQSQLGGGQTPVADMIQSEEVTVAIVIQSR